MTIQEAIKSGKNFWRTSHDLKRDEFYMGAYSIIRYMDGSPAQFSGFDILAEDWEVELEYPLSSGEKA